MCIFEDLKRVCSQEVGHIFSAKDLENLTTKAEKLIRENSIRERLESQSFLVKSFFSPSPHTVKSMSNGKYSCDGTCLGFKTRKICGHVIAVSYKDNNNNNKPLFAFHIKLELTK